MWTARRERCLPGKEKDMSLKKNRIVVKVGTSTLTNERGKSNLRRIEDLAMTLSDV